MALETSGSQPDDCCWVGKPRICDLLMHPDQSLRGRGIILPKAGFATISEIPEDAMDDLDLDIAVSVRAVREAFLPDRIAVVLLGIAAPQVTWHVIPI